MSIKYLLNGQISSDIYNLRNIVDSWSDNRTFPEIIDNTKNINHNDVILTSGFEGNTKELIKTHNPNRVFIFENAIFPKKGVKNFRIVDGNLNTLLKKLNSSYEEEKFYENCFKNITTKFPREYIVKPINIEEILVELPWDKNFYNLGKFINPNYLNEFEENLTCLKNESKTKLIKINKKQNALILYPKNYHLQKNKFFNTENLKLIDLINISKLLICPSNIICYLGIINKKKVLTSKYNPFYRWLLNNKNYEEKTIEKIIESLALYTSRLNFNINELFNFIEEKLI